MVVRDSIEFTTNANFQDVQLIAYGQDFTLVKGEFFKGNSHDFSVPLHQNDAH